MAQTTTGEPISLSIWRAKYRRCIDGCWEQDITDTWRRVAGAIAAAEPTKQAHWRERFYRLLEDYRFLPGGRILAGAGTGAAVTLCNCFVMGPVGNSIPGIFAALQQGALTLQAGGGIGYDFSSVPPASSTGPAGGAMPGPVMLMKLWDVMSETLSAAASRRGAMMASLRCDHPDIEHFVAAKRQGGTLLHCNCSVLVTDDFMAAVAKGASWRLHFAGLESAERTIEARGLWRQIIRAAYESAEPGVLFIDRMNARNNLRYCETISTTNPCGELPMPHFGACDLGSINLARFVVEPFAPSARLDLDAIAALVPVAVRFLDNVIEVSNFPLPEQARQARQTRRVGLGFTGLADALAMLGLDYGQVPGRDAAASIMRTIREAAYSASVELAREKGSFPVFDASAYLAAPGVAALPASLRRDLRQHGIRNSHLTAIAPAGSISLLAGNVSSGIEPIFELRQTRRLHDEAGVLGDYEIDNAAYRQWAGLDTGAEVPRSFVTARSLGPEQHLLMQAAVQPYVDGAISKTINVDADIDYSSFASIYQRAYELGLNGCSVFRPNSVTGSVLRSACGVA